MAEAVSRTIYEDEVGTGGVYTADTGSHLDLKTVSDDKSIRLNSRSDYAATSGDIIGFQAKPGSNASGTQSVYGGQVSPRLQDGIALTGSGSLIGLHVDAYLKGTTGNVAGDVRALQLELVDDTSSTRTVTGDSVGIRFRSAIEHTVTGDHVPILVEASEKATKWAGLVKLDAEANIFNDDANQAITSATTAGYIAVIVNGNTRYIWLASNKPTGP